MGRINVALVFYRTWAEKISQNVVSQISTLSINENITFTVINSSSDLNKISLEDFQLMFFIGWSDIVPNHIIENVKCVCLHPSDLPRFRGGSPLQHQIINGLTNTKLTFFIMNSKVDQGDIIIKTDLSLDGEISDIFDRIIEKSPLIIISIIIEYFLTGDIKVKIQDNNSASYFKRRTPDMSEISIDDFAKFTALELHNKVRSLGNPYPTAFIRCKGGSVLFINKTSLN